MSQPSSGVPRAGRIATLFDLFWGELARRIRTRAQWRRRGLLGKPTKQQQRRRAMRLEAL